MTLDTSRRNCWSAGAALTGLRPVVELQFSDFAAVAFDQIVNQAANVRYVVTKTDLQLTPTDTLMRELGRLNSLHDVFLAIVRKAVATYGSPGACSTTFSSR